MIANLFLYMTLSGHLMMTSCLTAIRFECVDQTVS